MRNILVFLTDDHGAWAGGFAGNREIHSPSMDYIAREGASFSNAFTPCPVAPRQGLLFGQVKFHRPMAFMITLRIPSIGELMDSRPWRNSFRPQGASPD